MAWRSIDPMDERLCFIADWLTGAFGVSELSVRYGVSRKTGYKWLRRYREEGVSGLAERSRAPHGNSRSVEESVRELLLLERECHPSWGARKLLAVLGERYPELEFPSASTAHEVLRRGGLVKSRRRRRRRVRDVSGPVVTDAPNAVWCADFKGEFRLGNGEFCYALTISDNFSRYLLCCAPQTSTKGSLAKPVFEWVFREYGLPEALRTDNGIPFASSGAGRLTRLSVWLLKQGITLDRIRPGHPEENGRHERMHRTLKAEATRPPSYSHAGQGERFDGFRKEYNDVRPHEALGQIPPSRVYVASSRVYDGSTPEPEYPGYWEVRKVRRTGEIKWFGKCRYLTETLAGEWVGLYEVEDGIWDIVFASHPVAVYDARREKIYPVMSGIAGRRVGFSACGSTDDGNGQSAKPCPHP